MGTGRHQTSCKGDAPGDLRLVSIKLRGLGILFRLAKGEVPIEEEEFHGISYIIMAIADDVDRVCEVLED